MIRSVATPLLLTLLLLPSAAADPPDTVEAQGDTATESDISLWNQIQALYESAKKAGEIDAAIQSAVSAARDALTSL